MSEQFWIYSLIGLVAIGVYRLNKWADTLNIYSQDGGEYSGTQESTEFNTDGSMMIGCTDIHGNTFGSPEQP